MNDYKESKMDSDSDGLLATRLAALNIPVPATLIPRTLAAGDSGMQPARKRRRPVIATAVAVAALIAGNLGASYLSPRYAQALASAPGAGVLTGPILREAGLATANPETLDVQATASGYTIRLFGAYADSVRTTIFIQILAPDGREAPDGTVPAFNATLTDQFGNVYHMMNGFGMPVLHFQPLTGSAAALGARLTLRIDTVDSPASPATGSGTAVPTTARSTTITGPWNLPFSVTSTGGQNLALPPPVRLGDTTYTFTALRTTSTLLEVTWTITGGAMARQQQMAEQMGSQLRDGDTLPADLASKQRASYDEIATSRLIDSEGNTVEPIYGYGQIMKQDGKTANMSQDAWFPVTSHGHYQFEVDNVATGQNARTIDIP